jgi:serine/threonine-protein kinase
MGVVYAARHIALGQLVAIKCLTPSLLGRQDVVERFSREARALAALRSQHVARVLDVGRFEGDAPYMVMEFLEGEDLGSLLATNGRMSIELACVSAVQACEALAEAHQLGIVHRDIKPENLFLARGSQGQALIKLLDFGISKLVQAELGNASLTQSSVIMGSPLYMSPEQLRDSRCVDARSDVYSLGATLYELLTGWPLFEAKSVPEACALILRETPVAVRARCGDIPEALDAVVMKALARDPGSRYQSAIEFAAALAPFAASQCHWPIAGGFSTLPPPQRQSDHSLAPTIAALPRVPASRSMWASGWSKGAVAATAIVLLACGTWFSVWRAAASSSAAQAPRPAAGGRDGAQSARCRRSHSPANF